MSVAPGTFRNSLPNILIDQISFEADREKRTNKVKIDFLYQIPQKWSRVSPYRVMVIMTDNDDIIQKLLKHESYAKHCVLEDTNNTSEFMKAYLFGDESGEMNQFSEIKMLDAKSGFAIAQRSVTFRPHELDQSLWPNLYIYAVAYQVSPQDITASGVSKKIKSIKIGMPAAETVYVGNRTTPIGIVYQLKETTEGFGKKGDIWTGQCYTHRGQTIAGAPGSTTRPVLKPNFVSNQKLQDKSFMQEQGLLFQKIDRSTNSLSRRTTQNLEVARRLMPKANNGISDVYFSRTRDNVLKAFFSVNYKHFVQANTKMNFLFSNKDALDSCFKVENIRLFRTRIRLNIAGNSLTPGKLNVCGTKAQSAPKLVATLTGGTIRGITYANQAAGVISYVATDIEMAGKDAGVYEYTLEIDAVDNSAAALHHLLKQINTNLTAYDQWLAKIYYTPGARPGNDARRRIRSQSTFLQQDPAWKKLIESYLASIIFIFGKEAFAVYSLDVWRKNLLAMANPKNGNLDNMREVGALVRNFYSMLYAATSASTLGKSSRKFSTKSKMGTKSPSIRRISFSTVFPNVFENNQDAATGFDYLDENLVDQGPALSGMTYSKFNSRIGKELGKFNVSGPSAQQVNPMGYLTPVRIKTPTNIIETSALQVGLDNTMDLLNAKMKPQMPQLSFQSTISPSAGPSSDIDSLLHIAGVTIQPLLEDITVTRNLATPTLAMAATLQMRDSSVFLSTTSPFIKDDAMANAAASGSIETKIRYSSKENKNATSSIKRSGFVKSLINAQVASFSQNVRIQNVVGVRGSLAAKKISDNPILVQENNLVSTAINLNSIQQIQYFQGFTINSSGAVLMDQPIWAILTQAIFDRARNDNSVLLCRLQSTTNVTSGGNSLELDGYDSLFMIGSGKSADTGRQTASYQSYYSQLMSVLKNTQKNIIANIDTPISNVPPSQITTPIIRPARISDKSIVNIGMSNLRPIIVDS